MNFVVNNQDCSKESVIKALEKWMSRKTVFKLLDELILEHTITEKKSKPNSRDYKLSVDRENPVVLIPMELEEFDKIFFSLLQLLYQSIIK